MPSRLEDYALIGDCETAALVGKDGSIDWLCLPRFDSGACFVALLGRPENGRWLLAPAGEVREVRRRYCDDTLILETTFETAEGAVTLVDCMPVREEVPVLIRCVRGERGRVPMRTEVVIRFDYGSVVPWVRRADHGIRAVAGPNALHLYSDVNLHGKGMTTVADFTVAAGQEVVFMLAWHLSYKPEPELLEPREAVRKTEQWWRDWSARCTYQGPWREQVLRSLLTLKALTYAPTGGIVAAPTTSRPRRPRCPSSWAASATGTTATAGSATPPSRSWP
jgi:GH15 family glucan-1,4-alpha-glucosidase